MHLYLSKQIKHTEILRTHSHIQVINNKAIQKEKKKKLNIRRISKIIINDGLPPT